MAIYGISDIPQASLKPHRAPRMHKISIFQKFNKNSLNTSQMVKNINYMGYLMD
jgi:hypothetical protein